jgi:hypothetical protein
MSVFYLIPSIIQSHRHRTNKWFYSSRWLVIRCSKSSPNIFIIQHLAYKKHHFHFHCKILKKKENYDWMHTWTSKLKYFFIFLTIITKNGSFMPRVFFGSAGQVMYVVDTFVPTISNTKDWISLSVILFICPFRT